MLRKDKENNYSNEISEEIEAKEKEIVVWCSNGIHNAINASLFFAS